MESTSEEAGTQPLMAWNVVGFDPIEFFPEFRKQADIIRYVVGLVAVGPAKWSKLKDKDRWFPLRFTKMDRLFGYNRNWIKVVRSLGEAGILECDELYTIGEKSKWYRLGDAWFSTVSNKCQQPAVLLARLAFPNAKAKAKDEVRSKAKNPSTRTHRALEQASESRRNEVRDGSHNRNRSWKQRLTAIKIKLIQAGDAKPKRDDYLRVHSPIVNFRKTVRHALRIHGRRTNGGRRFMCVASLARLHRRKAPWLATGRWQTLKGWAPRVNSTIRSGTCQWSDGRLSCCHPTTCSTSLTFASVGKFYEVLAEIWGIAWDEDRAKQKVKNLAFRYILFGKVKEDSQRWLAFKDRWPAMAIVLEHLKEQDHGIAARAAQRIEGLIMIDGVVEWFRRNRPELPVITLHDALMVTDDGIEVAREAITREFSKLGLLPLVKAKRRFQANQKTNQTNMRESHTNTYDTFLHGIFAIEIKSIMSTANTYSVIERLHLYPCNHTCGWLVEVEQGLKKTYGSTSRLRNAPSLPPRFPTKNFRVLADCFAICRKSTRPRLAVGTPGSERRSWLAHYRHCTDFRSTGGTLDAASSVQVWL